MTRPPTSTPDGILLGYSLEHRRHVAPIGFQYGGEDGEGGDGYLEPILMTGDGHLITIAPTGAGKGVSCMIPTLLRFPGPVIVVDPKGENYAVTARRRRELGQEVILLDPLGITDADEVASLNPLDIIDTSHPQSIEDSAMLASLLGGGIEKIDPKNRFWYERGEQLLTGVIQHVAVQESPRSRTLTEVRRLLNLPLKAFLNVAEMAMGNSPDRNVRITAGIVTNPSIEMTGSIMAMAQNSMEFLRGGLIEHSTKASTFDLNQVVSGAPLSIYLVIPPDKLESLRGLLRVWIGTLMALLMRRRSAPPMRTLFMLDEAAQLGPLDQLRQAVTLMRGYGLQTWSFWQDMSQLQNLYPRDWQTMLNNSRVQQAFGFMSLQAAEAACDLMGFWDPREVLRLHGSEMLLSVSGDETVIARKPNYLRDELFDGLYDENPFYREMPDGPAEPRTPPRWYVRPEAPSRLTPREPRPEGPSPFSAVASRAKGKTAPGWTPVRGDEREDLLSGLNDLLVEALPPETAISRVRLFAYPRHDLLRIARPGEDGFQRAYAFYASGEVVPLDWDADTIHTFNRRALKLTQVEEIRGYLRFFSWAIRGAEGRFFMAESLHDVPVDPGEAADEAALEKLGESLHPVRSIDVPDAHSGSYGFATHVCYDGHLFMGRFLVSWRGYVTMTSDEPLDLALPLLGDDLGEGGYFTLDVE